MSRLKILVIDDEKDIVELLKYNLEKAGYKVIFAYDGKSALDSVEKNKPDLIILDLMLPEIDGIEICKFLKQNEDTKDIPIIMLTARTSEMDKILGLDLGADDYITKPFSVREVVARVKTVLRRLRKGEKLKERIKIDDLIIDFVKHEVSIKGKPIELTFREFELLKMFAENQGRVLSRDQLLTKAWGYDYAGETRTIDVHIRRLRTKLKHIAKRIITVKNVGYKFI